MPPALSPIESVTLSIDSWTQWTSYSACSATCGDGQSFRTRTCSANDGTITNDLSKCEDAFNRGTFQSQSCNIGPCCEFVLPILPLCTCGNPLRDYCSDMKHKLIYLYFFKHQEHLLKLLEIGKNCCFC